MTTFLDKILFSPDSIGFDLPIVQGSLGHRVPAADRSPEGIIYGQDKNTDVPREVVLSYLRDCSYIILQKENVEEIIADSQFHNITLQESAVIYQQGKR